MAPPSAARRPLLAALATGLLATARAPPPPATAAAAAASSPARPPPRAARTKAAVRAALARWAPRPAPLPAGAAPPGWLLDLPRDVPRYARLSSQSNQDGVLAAIFDRIGVTNRYYVEFGFNSATYEGGSGANTLFLHRRGFRGLLLDGSNRNESINLHAHYLYRGNVAQLFARYGVPRAPDYVSCDMDSHDAFVLRGILEGGYRPRVLTTEFNPNWAENDTFTLQDPSMLGGGVPAGYAFAFAQCVWGASPATWRDLAAEFGYTLVHRVGLFDLVWLRSDLLEAGWAVPPWSAIAVGGKREHRPASAADVAKVVDYAVWRQTGGDLEAARRAAQRALLERYATHWCVRRGLAGLRRAQWKARAAAAAAGAKES